MTRVRVRTEGITRSVVAYIKATDDRETRAFRSPQGCVLVIYSSSVILIAGDLSASQLITRLVPRCLELILIINI